MNVLFNSGRVIVILSLFIIVHACAPTRFVQPLDEGQSAVGFNAGGPLIHFAGTVIPVPFTSVYYGYGVNEKGTASAGLHLTSLIYRNLQMDLAYTQQLLDQKSIRPAISVTGGSQFIYGLREGAFRFYPTVDLNAYFEYGHKKQLSYVSLNSWFDPQPGKITEGSSYHVWRPSIAVGHLVKFKNWEVGIEYKLLGFTLDNTKTVVDYATNFDHGAHGIYLQCFKKF